eukprot:scaffold95812_cov69-Phaeocystis_antarctica.AAC.5
MGAKPARATATTTTIAMSDLGASNATARRRSLAARAQGNTTGTTAHVEVLIACAARVPARED